MSKKQTQRQSVQSLKDLEKANLSYEEAAGRLEETLQALESGDRSLEDSLLLYEDGAVLATYCAKKLDEAELRVRKWQPEGEPTELDDWSDTAE